ncbi:MAG: hypothetical protein DCC56_09530 [Anaerolineae bacterium]|nr:MAG: hypothetical protein DCC56_09530 [Anaerolineae bacterium]WKZ45171.1 MAG: hypothetical protein QY302_05210 [Anaerolineales bacterium]
MVHSNFLGMKLSDEEQAALILWAKEDGIEKKSVMMRRIFRMALRHFAPVKIFPPQILDALNLSREVES